MRPFDNKTGFWHFNRRTGSYIFGGSFIDYEEPMKPYLVTTGILFGLIAVLHVWRAIAEWPHGSVGPWFALGMAALVALPGVLSCWAWRLLLNLSADRTKRGSEKMPGKDSDDAAA